jgi:outer membrane murein-binding lipoprotein Lpp
VNEWLALLEFAKTLGPVVSPLNTLLLLAGVVVVLRRTGTIAAGTTSAVQGSTNQLGTQVSNLALAIGELRSTVGELARTVRNVELDHARMDERMRGFEARPPAPIG